MQIAVYILIQGRVPIGGPQIFMDVNTTTGIGTQHVVTVGDYGSDFSVQYSLLPSAGYNRKTIYIPQTDSFLVFISFEKRLNIPVISDSINPGVPKIADPEFDNPDDPYGNFNTIWDQVEGAYIATTPNIAVDATAVSFLFNSFKCLFIDTYCVKC
jgi:hypothetical protein